MLGDTELLALYKSLSSTGVVISRNVVMGWICSLVWRQITQNFGQESHW